MGDPAATYCGLPWSQWLAAAGVTEAELWGCDQARTALPAAARTLWTARLFPVLQPRGPGPEAALWLQRPAEASSGAVAAWRACRRLSLRDLLARADVSAELRYRAAQRAAMAVARLRAAASATVPLVRGLGADLGEAVRGPMRAASALSALRHASLAAAAGAAWAPLARALALTAQLLARTAGGTAPRPPQPSAANERAGGWRGLHGSLASAEGGVGAVAAVEGAWARILPALACPHEVRQAAAEVEAMAFAAVSRAVAPPLGPSSGLGGEGRAPLPVGAVVRVRCPARVDLAGGWSDTPPITYTAPRGGYVVNVAVTVNGEAPILVTAERIPQVSAGPFIATWPAVTAPTHSTRHPPFL